MRVSSLTAVTVGALAVPCVALAAGRLTPTTIFFDAAPVMKLVMFLLIIATLAAIVVAVRKVLSGPSLSGGSTFLQALRLGGPLIGLLGAAFNTLMINIGIANVGDVSYAVLAPGVAEAAFLFVLGLIAGVVAVICNWVVEARIDRTVLRA
ncbi:MotA/TolQ/ExbB proton channel family protein [Brevundimonas sp. NPDC092305]|uniref:MotA/TolQ/ExbB proton channel family protein n=1 Tax=Brevundimonas sp. NPDC092305 TaxID=3363957 RepID=UPI0037FF9329